jgi:uncharacterized protein YraI
MSKHFAIQAIAAGVGLLVLSGTALAQSQAYANAPVDIYAGPAPDYPVVAQVPQGAPLTVMGCVEDYSWCDVAAPGVRGWVYGGYLSYAYQGAEVPVMTYGATIGLPIVVFSIDSYWGHYYRDRSWYHDEPRWAHHPPPERGARPPERGGDVGRPPGPPPGPQPGHEAPAYGRAPGAPPVHGGPPQAQPQTGYARPIEQTPPHGGGPSPQPAPQAQAPRGMQPAEGPAHAMGGPQMRPGAAPPPREGNEARGDQGRGGSEHDEHPSNH